jgi:hypothetical protein
MPSLLNDGPLFFPNVLQDPDFKKRGYLYQVEAGGAIGLHWVVIDPRKHVMSVWRKDEDNFVEAAKAQAATVVTNGPFFTYNAGSKADAVKQFSLIMAAATHTVFSFSGLQYCYDNGLNPLGVISDIYDKAVQACFGGDNPVGHIYAKTQGFEEKAISAPNGHYFGSSGPAFADYIVGQGESPPISEVIGGLIRVVENYAVTASAGGDSNEFGYWGLAPLDPAAAPWSDSEGKPFLIEALASLAASNAFAAPNMPPVDGVLITAFHSGRPREMGALMSRSHVKDLVQLDGDSSVLLGVGSNIVVGSGMLDVKRAGNCWGYKFDAVP